MRISDWSSDVCSSDLDRHWQLISANAGLAPLLAGVAPHLLEPPVNVLRVSLHPEGAAPRIANLPEWRAHIFHRLETQIDASADAGLARLLEELRAYPGGTAHGAGGFGGVAVPFLLKSEAGGLVFLRLTDMFVTPLTPTPLEMVD